MFYDILSTAEFYHYGYPGFSLLHWLITRRAVINLCTHWTQ